MSDVGRFTFPAMPESLSAARSYVRGVLQSLNQADRELDVNIAVGEILQNIVRYGFDGGHPDGEFTIQFIKIDAGLKITINDNASPSNPDEWSNAHRKPEEGGHGLALVHAIASSVEFKMLEQGNCVNLEFRF